MSMKAIADVEAAEAQARQLKADAAQQAKNAAAEAEAQGRKVLEAARQRAAEELRTLNEKADGRIQAAAQELLRETEAQKDRLRTQGESPAGPGRPGESRKGS